MHCKATDETLSRAPCGVLHAETTQTPNLRDVLRLQRLVVHEVRRRGLRRRDLHVETIKWLKQRAESPETADFATLSASSLTFHPILFRAV